MMRNPQGLYLKNAAIGLLLLIPLTLATMSSLQSNRSNQGPGEPDSSGQNDQPPIIVIHETRRYSFESGSAEIDSAFRAFLADSIAPLIRMLANKYSCDIIEVVGHTDGQPVQTVSNLDATLRESLAGGGLTVAAGSNLDLGAMRAWAVVRVLQASGQLRDLRFLGYSAGQTITIDGQVDRSNDVSNDPARRRIEIRVRRAAGLITGTTPDSQAVPVSR